VGGGGGTHALAEEEPSGRGESGCACDGRHRWGAAAAAGWGMEVAAAAPWWELNPVNLSLPMAG